MCVTNLVFESDRFQEWVTALVAAMKLHTAAANNHTKEMLRPFTKAGYMEKEGAKRKNWKRRFFVLKVCHDTRTVAHSHVGPGSVLLQAQ